MPAYHSLDTSLTICLSAYFALFQFFSVSFSLSSLSVRLSLSLSREHCNKSCIVTGVVGVVTEQTRGLANENPAEDATMVGGREAPQPRDGWQCPQVPGPHRPAPPRPTLPAVPEEEVVARVCFQGPSLSSNLEILQFFSMLVKTKTSVQ